VTTPTRSQRVTCPTTRPASFRLTSTLVYQEPVQAQLLFPGRKEVAQRNLGDRYRELLLSRQKLEQIVRDPPSIRIPASLRSSRSISSSVRHGSNRRGR
jgi:hypothetical protein